MIVCIDARGISTLTKGEEYAIWMLDYESNMVKLLNDALHFDWYPIWRFTAVPKAVVEVMY